MNNSPVTPPDSTPRATTAFVGLAPFLRMSIAGIDFTQQAADMIAGVQQAPDDAELHLNLSVALMCLGHQAIGLEMLGHALDLQRVYHIKPRQPVRLRLLILMVPGELSANVPVDCLLEDSDVELIYYYVSPDEPLKVAIPEHDVVLVGISAADGTRQVLAQLEEPLSRWPLPVINTPSQVALSERHVASQLLQGVPGLTMAQVQRITPTTLQDVARGSLALKDVTGGIDFPIILRPVGTHGGHGLERVNSAEDIHGYLSRVEAAQYFLARFIDYSAADDGLFRKARVFLIDGKPYACHMATSENWMIHYLNARMYELEERRAEEARFLDNFPAFAARHAGALQAIAERTGLDYLGIDCAQTRDGDLLVFEIDPAMVIHAMDLEAVFPNKQHHMQKVKTALHDLLVHRSAQQPGQPTVQSS
ncbi:ATP-grasp domain-containing protein [Pseudomonas sp. TE3610]